MVAGGRVSIPPAKYLPGVNNKDIQTRSITAVDPRYLKVKDAEQDLHAKNQLNKSIHSGRTGNLIESCDLRVHVYFDRHAKITVVTFSFREFVSA